MGEVLQVPSVCPVVPARSGSCGFAGCQSSIDLLSLLNVLSLPGSSERGVPVSPLPFPVRPSSRPEADVPVCGPKPEQAAGACCGDLLLYVAAVTRAGRRCGQGACLGT